MEISEKLRESVSPILEQQSSIQRIVEAANFNIPKLEVPTTAFDAVRDMTDNSAMKLLQENSDAMGAISKNAKIMQETTGLNKTMQMLSENSAVKALGEIAISTQLPGYTFQSPVLEKISTGMASVVQAFSSSAAKVLAESTANFMSTIGTAFIDAMKSPVIEWLQGLDLTPMYSALEGLRIDEELLERYRNFNKTYLTAMYECKWFPYAAWAADFSLAEQVSEVLNTSRGASKRREQRIDKLILSYYSKAEIKVIKRTWRESDLEPHIKRILGQAIEAHLRGEYALCISSLATMWEGLIYVRANNVSMQERHRQNMLITKQELAKLTEANDYDKIFSDYFDKFIVSSCNKVDDVVAGVPNRHGVSHSWYHSYPNKKASLNAILLTDFIIHLEPLEGEQMNGA